MECKFNSISITGHLGISTIMSKSVNRTVSLWTQQPAVTRGVHMMWIQMNDQPQLHERAPLTSAHPWCPFLVSQFSALGNHPFRLFVCSVSIFWKDYVQKLVWISFNGIVNFKMKIQSIFRHPNFVPNLHDLFFHILTDFCLFLTQSYCVYFKVLKG